MPEVDMTIDVLLNRETLALDTELMDMIIELYGPGEIEFDYDPFNRNFCIFKKEEDNGRGLQVDG